MSFSDVSRSPFLYVLELLGSTTVLVDLEALDRGIESDVAPDLRVGSSETLESCIVSHYISADNLLARSSQ